MSMDVLANVQESVLLHTIERQTSLDILTNVQVYVLLRPIEWQMSLDNMGEADFMSNMAAVLRDTTNSA